MQSSPDQQSKSSAVPIAKTGRSLDIIRLPTSTRVETAVADSTSVISARSSTSAGKRKSVEKDQNELKKRKLEKKEVNDRHKNRDTPAVTPLMDIVVPDVTPAMDIGSPAVTPLLDLVPRRTGVMYYCASTTFNFSNICVTFLH